MNSWQNSLVPFSISIRWTSMPGWWIGSMKTESPRCLGTSQLVRARQSPQSDHQAPVVHTFEPLSTHSSPSRTADVWAPATSEPPPGSDRNCIHSSSPLQDGREVPELLLLGPEVEDDGRARRDGGGLDPHRELVTDELLVEAPAGGPGSGPGRRRRWGSRCRRSRRRTACAAARGRGRPRPAPPRRCVVAEHALPRSRPSRWLEVGPDPGRARVRKLVDVLQASSELVMPRSRTSFHGDRRDPLPVLARGPVQRPVRG